MSAKAKLQKEEELRVPSVIYRREFNIRSKSAYNTNNYGLSVDGTNGDLYTCTYQGVLYLALIPSYTCISG
jgi:hypothetical protein